MPFKCLFALVSGFHVEGIPRMTPDQMQSSSVKSGLLKRKKVDIKPTKHYFWPLYYGNCLGLGDFDLNTFVLDSYRLLIFSQID